MKAKTVIELFCVIIKLSVIGKNGEFQGEINAVLSRLIK